MTLLVDEIAAKLDALDCKVDSVIAFVLREAVAKIRTLDSATLCYDTVDVVVDAIDPDLEQP